MVEASFATPVTADASGWQPDETQVTEALNRRLQSSLQPVARGVALLYIFLAISHSAYLPPGPRERLALAALLTAFILMLVSMALERWPAPSRHAHLVALGFILLALANNLWHLYLIPAPRLTTHVSLIIVGVGIYFFSARWFVVAVVMCVAGWLALSGPMFGQPNWPHFAFLQAGILFMSTLAFVIRRCMYRRNERLRLVDQHRQATLAAAVTNAEKRAVELTVAHAEAEMANRAKNVFLSKISHELRTPLTVILGYSEVLEEEWSRTTGGRPLSEIQAIQTAGHNLLNIVNDLIDLSRLEAGEMPLDPISFQVASLVEAVAVNARTAMSQGGNTLRVECAADSGVITSDATLVGQILRKLLANASRFTSDGEVVLAVTRTGPGDAFPGHVCFSVADSGVGIPPGQLRTLFHAFRQGDDSTRRRHDGAGLGLAICHRLSTLLGGHIDVASEVGRGTVFRVYLPASPDALPAGATLNGSPACMGQIVAAD